MLYANVAFPLTRHLFALNLIALKRKKLRHFFLSKTEEVRPSLTAHVNAESWGVLKAR